MNMGEHNTTHPGDQSLVPRFSYTRDKQDKTPVIAIADQKIKKPTDSTPKIMEKFRSGMEKVKPEKPEQKPRAETPIKLEKPQPGQKTERKIQINSPEVFKKKDRAADLSSPEVSFKRNSAREPLELSPMVGNPASMMQAMQSGIGGRDKGSFDSSSHNRGVDGIETYEPYSHGS
jgi:hypothetical protein